MRERPILFSGPMVRAILEDRKTQTRRVVKPTVKGCIVGTYMEVGGHVEPMNIDPADGDPVDGEISCPYGNPGDRLWVRETWRVGAWFEDDGQICVDYQADAHCRSKMLDVPDEQFHRLWVQSSDDAQKKLGEREHYQWEKGQSPCRWRPSIHMPRWASRITLEITGVRVERLQEISRGDAMSEGCPHQNMQSGPDPRDWYAGLWDHINGPGSWDDNPWAWVIEFRRIDRGAGKDGG